jgi:hypothetical protein
MSFFIAFIGIVGIVGFYLTFRKKEDPFQGTLEIEKVEE